MSESREESLFEQALGLPEAERGAFLDAECAGDPDLRRSLHDLLAAHGSDDPRLDTVAQDDAARPAPADLPGAGLARLRPPSRPNRVAGQQIGRYRLLELIGEGGCGMVYMAEQRDPVRRRVALKLLKPGMDSKSVIGRFEAERQALALMDHPNIARVLDAGTSESGHPYFVMELVRGTPITEFCDRENFSAQRRLELLIDVCGAIQHAHQKGIIHRDIKPSNVLVTILDGEPIPKVIDFGIAKATQAPLTDATVFTAFTQFIGTPAYMSPEQAGHGAIDIDTRADIYSLGVLLYELLTGSPPFDPRELLEAGFEAMRRRLQDERPQLPSHRLSTLAGQQLDTTARTRATPAPRLIRSIRGDLDWIVMKCLEKDRNRRYSSASGLAADLRRHLALEPVHARPPSRLYLFSRTLRRHKLAFAAFAAVFAALAGGLVVARAQAIRAEHARAQAAAAFAAADRASLRGEELFRMNDAWRSLVYECAQHSDVEWFSNLVIASEKRSLDDVKSPLASLLWRVQFSFMHAWIGDQNRAEQLMREAASRIESTFGGENRDARFARMWLADYLVAHGRALDAEGLLRTNLVHARQADPPDWDAIVHAERGLGECAALKQDRASMRDHFDASLAALPKAFGQRTHAFTYNLGLVAWAHFWNGFAREGMQILRDRLAEEMTFGEQLDGTRNASTRMGLADMLLRSGRIEEARALVDDGFRLGRDAPPGTATDLHLFRAGMLLREGHAEDALADAVAAYRPAPRNVAAWRAVGLLLLRSGQHERLALHLKTGVDDFLLRRSVRHRERVAALIALGATNPFVTELAATVARQELDTRRGLHNRATLALCLLRLGRFDEAVSTSRGIREDEIGDVERLDRQWPWSYAIRCTEAMAEWHLGNRARALALFDTSRERWIGQRTKDPRGSPWDWLDAELLFEEAARLMRPAPAPASSTPKSDLP